MSSRRIGSTSSPPRAPATYTSRSFFFSPTRLIGMNNYIDIGYTIGNNASVVQHASYYHHGAQHHTGHIYMPEQVPQLPPATISQTELQLQDHLETLNLSSNNNSTPSPHGIFTAPSSWSPSNTSPTPQWSPPPAPSLTPHEQSLLSSPTAYLRNQYTPSYIPAHLPLSLSSLPPFLPLGSKPKVHYHVLVKLAIYESPGQRLTLKGICEALSEGVEWFGVHREERGWKDSIRHNLSLNRVFKKEPRSVTEPGRGDYWTLDVSAGEGSKRPRTNRRKSGPPKEQLKAAMKVKEDVGGGGRKTARRRRSPSSFGEQFRDHSSVSFGKHGSSPPPPVSPTSSSSIQSPTSASQELIYNNGLDFISTPYTHIEPYFNGQVGGVADWLTHLPFESTTTGSTTTNDNTFCYQSQEIYAPSIYEYHNSSYLSSPFAIIASY